MTTVTDHVFDVTNRCQVCGGEAKARYRRPLDHLAVGMRRKCSDCGFSWEEQTVRPVDSVSPVDAAERSPSPG